MTEPPDTDVTITFQFDLGELTRASRAVLKRGPMRMVRPALALLAIGLAAWAYYDAVVAGSDVLVAIVSASPWIILGLFWTFGFTAVLPLLTRRFATRDMPSMLGTQTRAFSEAGFFYATPALAQSFAWSAVHRIVETDEFILVFIAPAMAHYVPKHAIPVAMEAPLRTLLARHFADRPKRLQLTPWAA